MIFSHWIRKSLKVFFVALLNFKALVWIEFLHGVEKVLRFSKWHSRNRYLKYPLSQRDLKLEWFSCALVTFVEHTRYHVLEPQNFQLHDNSYFLRWDWTYSFTFSLESIYPHKSKTCSIILLTICFEIPKKKMYALEYWFGLAFLWRSTDTLKGDIFV